MTQKGTVLGSCHDDGCAGKDGVRRHAGHSRKSPPAGLELGKFTALPLPGEQRQLLCAWVVPGGGLPERLLA